MLLFLKLGGSLITDKNRPFTPRLDILDRLAGQIGTAMKETSDLQLILGHGSGSFGHPPASQYGTRAGVSGAVAWRGFTEVWYQASTLNRLVVEALRKAGLPAITLAPVSAVTARDGKVSTWNLTPLRTALDNGLMPVVHGDVVFDEARGGTILSTEDLFVHLAHQLHPKRILLAGLERGVWEDFPTRTNLIQEITPEILARKAKSLGGSTGADVTGGMLVKVTDMVALVEQEPGLEVLVFSGEEPGTLLLAMKGAHPGTWIHC
jgi:isopentenyl phosphate kinase